MIKQILFAGMFALSAVACGGNECEDAADKADECGVMVSPDQQAEIDAAKEECSGSDECIAKCTNDATCEELKSTDFNNDYFRCAAACLGDEE